MFISFLMFLMIAIEAYVTSINALEQHWVNAATVGAATLALCVSFGYRLGVRS